MSALTKTLMIAFITLPFSAFALETDEIPASIVAPPATAIKTKPEHYNRADANKDGVVSKAEFMAEADIRFKKFDANGDESISKDEFKAHRDARKAKRKKRQPK